MSVNIQESGEMYLETILTLRGKLGNVRSIDIVNETGYSKPSVSRAVGLLRDGGYINVGRDGYITLTASGEALARRIYDRHTLLTKIFIHLGVTADVAAADACKIEHHISDETFGAIKRYIDNNMK